MFKKTLTYTDYEGKQIKEDFYFNLSKAEILEMQLEVDGGFDAKLQRIVDAKDLPSIIKIFKDFILRSYGVKSDDGKRFIKSDKLREEFSQSIAYSEIFMEFATNAESGSVFINSIIPQDLLKEIEEKNSQKTK